MCMNKKIREMVTRMYSKPSAPLGICGPRSIMTPSTDELKPKPGLTMKIHWNLIKHRIEREYEANQG